MAYSTRHLADLFGVSRETIRSWSREFADYLSPTATPGENRHRQFVDDDLKVFSLVHQQKQAGMLFADIHAALANGIRAEIPSGEDLAITEAGQQKLSVLTKRITQLEQQLDQAAYERDIKGGQIELLERQLREARDRIDQLNREIGRLEAGRADDD